VVCCLRWPFFSLSIHALLISDCTCILGSLSNYIFRFSGAYPSPATVRFDGRCFDGTYGWQLELIFSIVACQCVHCSANTSISACPEQ
jgi:hypothetical protein